MILAVLLIAGGIGAFVLLSNGGSDSGDGGGGGGPEISTETPDFAFDMRHFDVVASSTETKIDHDAMQSAADNVTASLDTYYRSAFLDPSNWREGTYDSAWSAYEKEAVADAKAQADVVTLGDQYTDSESVMPKPSTDSVTILLGPSGKPETAVAQVTFGALVKGPAGPITVSTLGHFFLHPEGGKDWKIYAFRLDRGDEPGDHVVGSPSPEPKPKKDKATPSAEESP